MGQSAGSCSCLRGGQPAQEGALAIETFHDLDDGSRKHQLPPQEETLTALHAPQDIAATSGPIAEVPPAACVIESSDLVCDARSADDMPQASGSQRSWSTDEIVAAGVSAEDVAGVVALSAELGVNCMEPLCDPLTLQRWYIARDRDAEAAAAMYRSTMQWRLEFSIGRVMAMHGKGEHYENVVHPMREHDTLTWRWQRDPEASYEAELTQRHAFFGRLRQCGADGEPILVWRVGVADVGSLQREGLVECFKASLVAHLEDTFQTTRAVSQRSKRMVLARVVIDVQGIGFTFIRNIWTVKQLFFTFAYFPEGISTITVVRAPGMFTQAWRLISPALPPRTRAKFRIIGEDFAQGLREHAGLELQALPEFLGGNTSDGEVCAAAPIPLGLGATLTAPESHRSLNVQ